MRKKKPAKPRLTNNQSVGSGGSKRWSKSRKERFDDVELQDQAVTAAANILLKQQYGVAFDRSSSLRFPNSNGHSRKNQGLPRSSSSRARSLTDPLLQPHQLVVSQVR